MFDANHFPCHKMQSKEQRHKPNFKGWIFSTVALAISRENRIPFRMWCRAYMLVEFRIRHENQCQIRASKKAIRSLVSCTRSNSFSAQKKWYQAKEFDTRKIPRKRMHQSTRRGKNAIKNVFLSLLSPLALSLRLQTALSNLIRETQAKQ